MQAIQEAWLVGCYLHQDVSEMRVIQEVLTGDCHRRQGIPAMLAILVMILGHSE
ncbi:hypothetical protein SS323385_1441 [Shigella sonnei 3233-85]|nr:hypothetical protein ECLT68_0181 [Escherichia coli LT-68]EIQ45365.1 hypothetical protein SS323385_1441 [Shigella sonnei 3233-85]